MAERFWIMTVAAAIFTAARNNCVLVKTIANMWRQA